jgi:hypothetical protein
MADRSLADEIEAVMQRILDINARWPGDYALFVQSSCTEADTVTHFEWYFKPPMAGASGDMAGMAERPPGYENPEASDG